MEDHIREGIRRKYPWLSESGIDEKIVEQESEHLGTQAESEEQESELAVMEKSKERFGGTQVKEAGKLLITKRLKAMSTEQGKEVAEKPTFTQGLFDYFDSNIKKVDAQIEELFRRVSDTMAFIQRVGIVSDEELSNCLSRFKEIEEFLTIQKDESKKSSIELTDMIHISSLERELSIKLERMYELDYLLYNAFTVFMKSF